MLNRQQQFGKKSERLAVEFLNRMGYRILETNYRSKLGEIDIIAREKGIIVFIEVKARSTGRFGSPKGAVTPAKQRKISMAALDYLKRTGQVDVSARFDVVAIDARRLNGGWEVVVHSGRRTTGRDALAWAEEVCRRGAGEILLTSMDRDGTCDGYDLELTAAISEAVSVPAMEPCNRIDSLVEQKGGQRDRWCQVGKNRKEHTEEMGLHKRNAHVH